MPSPLAMALTAPLPQQGLPTPTVGATNVAGIYNDTYQSQLKQYQADLAQKNAMWGGLASLAGTIGGAAIGGPMGAAMGGGLGKAIGGGGGTSSVPSPGSLPGGGSGDPWYMTFQNGTWTPTV